MSEPKIIEGKARRRPPLSKPLALVYIVLCAAMIGWMLLTPPYTLGHMLFASGMAFAGALILAELIRNLD